MSRKSIKDVFSKEVIINIVKGFAPHIFQSEAQFQHVLAIKLKKFIEDKDNYELILEPLTYSYLKTIKNGKTRIKRCYTDIVLLDRNNNEYIAIELKYKTKTLEYIDKNYGTVKLLTHGANDEGCYDFLKDLLRIETLVMTDTQSGNLNKCKCIGGYAIILTNDDKYWNFTPENCTAGYSSLCIGEGTSINKGSELNWDKKKSEKMSDHHTPISFTMNHGTCKWEKYCNLENSEFRFLCLEA